MLCPRFVVLLVPNSQLVRVGNFINDMIEASASKCSLVVDV